MNIGFEAKRIFQNSSGLGNYSRNTINLLARFYPENSYKLFAPKQTTLYTLPESAQLILPDSGFLRFFGSYWRMHFVSRLLKKNKIDLFHGLSHLLPYGIEKTGIPSVVTMHDLIFLRYPEFYQKIDRKMYRTVYESSCHRATKIIAISKQTKDDIIHFFGISPNKIEVIYQSCNHCYYEKVPDELKSAVRARLNLPDKFILCVGTIQERKNQLSILKAVVREKLDIAVVILGKPRPKEYILELNRFIRDSGIRNQVIFLHNTTTAEVQAIYQMAHMMIYPSFFEGFGLPVLEAQASGCPVITSTISSLPEAGGEGALYIDPKDVTDIGKAIVKILGDDGLRNELIRKGNINAGLFSEQTVAGNLMDLYRRLYAVK